MSLVQASPPNTRLYDASGNPIGSTTGLAAIPGTLNRLATTNQSQLVTTVSPGQVITGGTSSNIFMPSSQTWYWLLFVSQEGGTNPVLNIFIDAAEDTQTNFFQIGQLGPASIAAAPTPPVANTMPTNYASAITAATWYARVRWTLTGTNPTATFIVYCYVR